MKNIHILPTNKPSRLHLIEDTLTITSEYKNSVCDAEVNIYITSNEEIKVGDWVIEFQKNDNIGQVHFINNEYVIARDIQKKIILTTDQELIKVDVQSIDDEFLEWFVKNPSCEEVEVEVEVELVVLNEYGSEISVNSYGVEKFGYKIIIPKEKPKQLTDLEIAIKLEEIEREEVRAVNRTDLYNSILSIVKQIPRENVENDAMDATSCAYEIEQLFYKWQEVK